MSGLRILLSYWGRRGGGAHFTLCLGRALVRRSSGLALPVSRRGDLIEAFRARPLPRQEVDTCANLLGFAVRFLRVRALTRDVVGFAQEHGGDLVVSAMAHPSTPLVALARAGIAYVPVVPDSVQHPGDVHSLMAWRLRRELAATSKGSTACQTAGART